MPKPTAQTTPPAVTQEDEAMDQPEKDAARRRLDQIIAQEKDDTTWILDLTKYRQHDQCKWNLGSLKHRNEAARLVLRHQPRFVVSRATDADVKVVHKLCQLQQRHGGHFIYMIKSEDDHKTPMEIKMHKAVSRSGTRIYSDSESVINEVVDLRQGAGYGAAFDEIPRGTT